MKTIVQKGFTACFGTLMAMAVAAPVTAQEIQARDLATLDEIMGDRSVEELPEVLRPRPDYDVTDTALVFNNALHSTTVVRCVALGRDGKPMVKFRIKIPGNGLRFILASDFAHGRDFIGSAHCRARGKVVPAAFIVGPGMLTDTPALATFKRRNVLPVEPGALSITDTPADVDLARPSATRMRFPAVVTY